MAAAATVPEMSASGGAATSSPATDAISVEAIEPLTDIDGKVLSSKLEMGEESSKQVQQHIHVPKPPKPGGD